jgi:hypothetical protein
MATNQPNPYAAPQADVAVASQSDIFCTGLGAIIIGPWYLVRLNQWNSIARAQPMLLDPNVPRGSLAQRFQSARTKLIIGISFGALVLLLVLFSVGMLIFTAGPPT